MNFIARTMACLGAMLATACTAPGTTGTGDGTWTGLAKDYMFNTPGNWSPAAVPTGIATIPSSLPATAPVFFFSATNTTLSALRMSGPLGMLQTPDQTLTLGGEGLTLCCNQLQVTINGVLNSKATLSDGTGQSGHQLGGGGQIMGDLLHRAGTVTMGGTPDKPVLTVKGKYEMGAKATLSPSVFTDRTTRLDIGGKAILSGPLQIYVDDTTRPSYGPFKVLTAAGGITNKFSGEFEISGTYRVVPKYNPTDVTITLTRK